MIGKLIALPLYSLGILVSAIGITFFARNRLSSGEVKLHISSRYKFVEIILFVLEVAGMIVSFATAKIPVDYVEGFCFTGLAIWFLFLIKSDLEIRENGIFSGGELIPWGVIESYEWENFENSHKLKILRKRPFLGFSKEINLIVPSEKVEDAIVLLNQYLPSKGLGKNAPNNASN